MTDINDPFIPQLTSFEGNLIRLRTLMNKMELMFKHFTSIEDVGNEFNFKSLLREYIIIQLFAFMAVKRSLDRDLHEMGKDALNDCLRPLWQPIMDYERPIREMRNGYLAHIQDITPVFERHIEIITFESGFPSSWADSLFFAGCVWAFGDAIRENFKEQWFKAFKKYEVTIPPVINKKVIEKENQVEQKLAEIIMSINENLKQRGYRPFGDIRIL